MYGVMDIRRSQRPLQRALAVSEDPWLRRALRRAVREVFTCTVDLDTRVRRPLRGGYDLVILDVDLLMVDAFDLIEQVIATRPRPVTIVLSANAPARATFELGRIGVEAFLQKPFTFTDLRTTLIAARERAPSLELLGRSWAGRVELKAAQVDLRKGMLEQALLLSNGNLSHAARILSVSRQALQRTVRAARIGSAVEKDMGRP